MKNLFRSFALLSCVCLGFGISTADARTCFIVGKCGGLTEHDYKNSDPLAIAKNCKDLGYTKTAEDCANEGKLPYGSLCGEYYEGCRCSTSEYPWLDRQIAYPYTEKLANANNNPSCKDDDGTHYKYKVCQSKFITTYTPYGTWMVNDSNPNIYYPITVDLYNFDPTLDKYRETNECCYELVGQTALDDPFDYYNRQRCTGLVCKRSSFPYDWEEVDEEEERLGVNGIFNIGENCGDESGDYLSSVSCSGRTNNPPTGETHAEGAWKSHCADTEEYSSQYDAKVGDVTCHWCYARPTCDEAEYPWLETEIVAPYTNVLANRMTNPSCEDYKGKHYKYKVCQSNYRYTYDIYTIQNGTIYYDAEDTYGGGDEPYYANGNQCKEFASQTGGDDLYRYDAYTCSRSYFPYVWDEGDTEYRLIETDYTIFNVGEQCGDANGYYTSSLSCSGDTAHAPKGETHTTGAWKATCGGDETYSSQYDATVGNVTCHWCYKQPCKYTSQTGCESGNTGFTCAQASDSCYYPASCKSPYSNTQPSICKKYDGQIDLERLITKTAKNSSGTTIKCFSKEKIPCKELRYHGSLIGYDADGWPRTFYNRITIYEATSITAGGTGCETRYCYKPNVSIQAEIGDSITCFKTGMDTIRGTYRGYVNDATAQGLVNVEGYNCSIYKDGKTYITIPTGDGFHVKPN